MSAAIGNELQGFLNCLWYGVVLFGVYDILRIFRAMVRHAMWMLGLEDILFWIWAALFLFSHFFRDTYGAVRWYQLLGVGLGGIIWEYGCGKIVTKKLIFFVKWLKFHILRCKILTGMRKVMSRKSTVCKTVGEEYEKEKKSKALNGKKELYRK